MAQTNSILQVYGGDEVAAIVLDPGSHTTRIGYAGEDCPRIILPSYVGLNEVHDGEMDIDEPEDEGNTDDTRKRIKKRTNTYFSESSIDFPKSNAELKPIVKDGLIQDWDSAIEQWQYMFDNLNVDYEEQPLLLTEPVWNTPENRIKSLETILETFEFPGFYIASTPTCVAFAQGRPSALVVDVGHDISSVTPVVDGMCLTKTTLKTHYAGNFLNHQILHTFSRLNKEIIPRYKIKSKTMTKLDEAPIWTPKAFLSDIKVTQSFEDFQVEKVLKEMKESIIKIPNEVISKAVVDQAQLEELYPRKSFELPNGYAIQLDRERFEIGDSLFTPELYPIPSFNAESGEPEIESKNDYVPLKRGTKKPTDEDENDDSNTPIPESSIPATSNAATVNTDEKKATPKFRGLGELTSHALDLVDVDIRTQLAHNIIVTGSSSLIPGLTDRLYAELTKNHPSLKIRLHAVGNVTERQFQSWIGGSVLSSLGTFHQLWVSKKELEEVGADKLLSERFR